MTDPTPQVVSARMIKQARLADSWRIAAITFAALLVIQSVSFVFFILGLP